MGTWADFFKSPAFFKVLCIIPDKKFAKLKYKIPPNVVEIKNIYMDPFLDFSYLKVLKGNMVKDGEMTEWF